MNSSFTATFQPLADPALIHSPSTSSLNGGTLQNVIRALSPPATIYSTDTLLSLLNTAKSAKDTSSGPGLAVMTATLRFNPSTPPAAPVLDQLPVPILATVTINPPIIPRPTRFLSSDSYVLERDTLTINSQILRPNALDFSSLGPSTVQASLTASIP